MTERNVDPIVAELRAQRIRSGLTQAALAQRLRTGPSLISEREAGVHSPSLWMLRRWAALLGYTIVLAPTREPSRPSNIPIGGCDGHRP